MPPCTPAHLVERSFYMPKNDNAHSIRLVESIRQNAGADKANDFEQQFPLSKSANPEKKYEWAKNACDYLEQHFDADTVVRIRKECKCNDGKAIANKILKYLNKAPSTRQFVDAFNEKETFASLKYISENKILFCYPECYCACINRVPGRVSKTWCYCTLGNAESIFREVFQRDDIKVTLLESIKTGGEKCIIEVEW
jgi:hypothetical protein